MRGTPRTTSSTSPPLRSGTTPSSSIRSAPPETLGNRRMYSARRCLRSRKAAASVLRAISPVSSTAFHRPSRRPVPRSKPAASTNFARRNSYDVSLEFGKFPVALHANCTDSVRLIAAPPPRPLTPATNRQVQTTLIVWKCTSALFRRADDSICDPAANCSVGGLDILRSPVRPPHPMCHP